MKTNSTCASAVIPVQTVTESPPNGRRSSIKTLEYLSPGLLQTRRRPSDPVSQNETHLNITSDSSHHCSNERDFGQM